MSKRQREVLLIKFDNVNYNNTWESLDLIELITERYDQILRNNCDAIIEENNIKDISGIALDIRENNIKEFSLSIFEQILEEYSAIKEYPTFCKLLVDLNDKCGKRVFEYMSSVREEEFYKKEMVYESYSKASKKTRVMKILKGQKPNPNLLVNVNHKKL